MPDDNWTQEEYFKIREDVDVYLNSDEYKKHSAYKALNPDHKCVVDDLATSVYENSKLIEPEISADIKKIVLDGEGYLESFDHRLKTINGLRRKIIADSKDYNGSYRRAAFNLSDSVRYTIIINDDIYIKKVDEYLHNLEDMGYEVIDLKNNWGKKLYQGINVRIISKNKKDIFELQFHTPIGYQIKEGNTRDLYQVVRDENAPYELQIRANKLRKLLQSRVIAPPNVIGYEFNPQIRRRK